MSKMHKMTLACVAILFGGCSASNAYVDYSQFSAFSAKPGASGGEGAEELGVVTAESSGFMWSSCDGLVTEALQQLSNKATLRGGNSIYEVRFEDDDGKFVIDPTCVQEWGWVMFYPALLFPIPQTVTVKATAARISDGSRQGATMLSSRQRDRTVEDALGERTVRLKSPGIKCASLPISPLGISGDVAKLIDEVLLGELQGAGFEALGSDDINAMLGLEQLKDAVACDAASCMTEIGGALGVEYLISGKVGALDSAKLLTLKLIDVRQAKVLARANGQIESEAGLPDLTNRLVDDLVRQSGL